MAVIEMRIKTLSPIHLSSGAADVIVDSDVAHDRYGMPVFSGRRLKGLLRESALEVVCMKGLEKYSELIDKLFNHDCTKHCTEALTISDFHLVPKEEYDELCETWGYLQKKYSNIISPSDVLAEFTSMRYQTRLENGVAKEKTLRNMRVVDEGVEFFGLLEAECMSPESIELLALSVRNLRSAGLKRNRGFGRIRCSMKLEDNSTEQDVIDKLFEKGAQ